MSYVGGGEIGMVGQDVQVFNGTLYFTATHGCSGELGWSVWSVPTTGGVPKVVWTGKHVVTLLRVLNDGVVSLGQARDERRGIFSMPLGGGDRTPLLFSSDVIVDIAVSRSDSSVYALKSPPSSPRELLVRDASGRQTHFPLDFHAGWVVAVPPKVYFSTDKSLVRLNLNDGAVSTIASLLTDEPHSFVVRGSRAYVADDASITEVDLATEQLVRRHPAPQAVGSITAGVDGVYFAIGNRHDQEVSSHIYRLPFDGRPAELIAPNLCIATSLAVDDSDPNRDAALFFGELCDGTIHRLPL